eukprot:TRINITY_DN30142_c0_g1_i1.p1 TRINITY_DN30142_c0_g1~~TRINITY_DN30142_c0_g1_i1.p1  ORF type:complete len:379 (-),score=46.57 TRINITY_DN30142_c0_g1_i1:53-1189(-)
MHKEDLEYLRKNEIPKLLNDLALALVRDKPTDTLDYLGAWVWRRQTGGASWTSAQHTDAGYVASMQRKSSINLIRRTSVQGDVPPETRVIDAKKWAAPEPDAQPHPERPTREQLMQDFADPSGLFEVQKEISRGHYGTVYTGINTATQEAVAIKKVGIDGPWVVTEYENLQLCKCDQVVNCIGSWYHPGEDTLWLVMELVPYTVHDLLAESGWHLTESRVARILRQVLLGLHQIHTCGRVHLDIKPANLLLSDDERVKIADFGTMVKIGDDCIQLGDFAFMAPEVAHSHGKFCAQNDTWGIGCTALTLADGAPPLAHDDPKLLMYIHAQTCLVPGLFHPERWSADFNDFISQCFVKEVSLRATATDLLVHPFIRDVHA